MRSGKECRGDRSRTTFGRSLLRAFPTVSTPEEWACDASGMCCVRTRKLDPLVVATCVAASQAPSSGAFEGLLVRLPPTPCGFGVPGKPDVTSEIIVRLKPDTTYADVAHATSETSKIRRGKSRDRMSQLALRARDLVAGPRLETVQHGDHIAIVEANDHVVVRRLQRQPMTRAAEDSRPSNIIRDIRGARERLPARFPPARIGRGGDGSVRHGAKHRAIGLTAHDQIAGLEAQEGVDLAALRSFEDHRLDVAEIFRWC
jgi:hypothetical protein